MAGTIYEWFSYLAADQSARAGAASIEKTCAFVPGKCTKKGGVCSIQYGGEPVIVCPKRLYFDGHRVLREIARDAFVRFDIEADPEGLPYLAHGNCAREASAFCGKPHVGVFGNGFVGEVKLPAAMPGGARYSVDFTLVLVDPAGELLAFVPVEVQTIDTTSDYKASLAALERSRAIESSSKLGMNWENVNKRILPQLIVKGLMLQGERLCATGLYFVTPEPVFKRIMMRLGGEGRLRHIPKQPGSITFIRYQYSTGAAQPGVPVALTVLDGITISTSDMSLAFISPENLPTAGSYEKLIRTKL